MKNILLVDDDTSFLQSLREGLEDFPEYAVTIAENGKAAIDALNSTAFHLVITDLRMPGMTGEDLISYMGRNFQHIPIIVMTAFGTDDMASKFQLLGVTHFLEKPLDFNALTESMESVLASAAPGESQTCSAWEVIQTLEQTLQGNFNGEVVVKSGTRIGKIFVFNQHIAWVTASTIKPSLMKLITSRTDLEKGDLLSVYNECKQNGHNFPETLVAWGLITRDAIRAILLEHVASALAAILNWDTLQTLFLPQSLTYESSLIFSLEELLDNARVPESIVTRREQGVTLTERSKNNVEPALHRSDAPSVEGFLERISRIDGFYGAALFNREGALMATPSITERDCFSPLGSELLQLLMSSEHLTTLLDAGSPEIVETGTPSHHVQVRSAERYFTPGDPGVHQEPVYLVLITDVEANVVIARREFATLVTELFE